MSFLTICPRSESYNNYNVTYPISLKVIQDKGVDFSPDINVKVNKWNKDRRQLINDSGSYDTFKIDVIINKNDVVELTKEYTDWSWQDEQSEFDRIIYMQGNATGVYAKLGKKIKVLDALDYWSRNAEPVMVVTDAIDVPDDLYVIINNDSRKQTYNRNTVWTLTFMRYKDWSMGSFKKTNKNVTTALKKYKTVKKKIKTINGYKKKLKKCDYTHLKYSKKKKVLGCVKVMQQILYKEGYLKKKYVNGWFTHKTEEALKKFQKKFKIQFGLTVNGKVDKKTFKALCNHDPNYK